MKRKTKYRQLSEDELSVCARLRQIRESSGFSQALTAKTIGIGRDQLARIEAGLVAPLFGPGWLFCQFTGLNPLWLAFGTGETPRGWADSFQAQQTPPASERFLDAMRGISEAYRRHRKAKFTLPGDFAFLNARQPASEAASFTLRLTNLAQQWQKDIPPEEWRRFFFYLATAAEQFKSKKLIASVDIHEYLIAMPNSLPLDWGQLRSRLLRLIKKPGEKARLARTFGVSAPAVSQWLSAAPRPTADMTLKLLTWVLEAEAQQKKSAGSAETRPARATQKSKSTSHEKAKSDRKKK